MLFFFDLELDYSRVRSSLDNWFDKDGLVGTVPILFFFFSRLENSRWFVFQRVFFVRRRFSSSHSRFLGGNVDYDVRCIQKGIRGRWSRTRDFKIIRPSFSIISPSFYLYVHWNIFSRLKPDIIKIHILMKNRFVRFYRSRFRIFFKCFYMAWKFLFEKFLCGQYESPLSCSPSLPR